MKADAYAYRDRRNRKRDFRRLWITRINAAARQNGMSYGDVHARPEAGRHRARPQGPGRHRRARSRDLPPICRDRPRGGRSALPPSAQHRQPNDLRGRRSFQDGRPFRSRTDHDHLPPQPDAQGHPPARTRRGAGRRRASWPRARTWSPPPTRRAGRRSCGSSPPARLEGVEVEPDAAGEGLRRSGSGTRELGGLRGALARAGGPALRGAVGRQGSRQRRHRAARRARLRRGERRDRPGHAPTRSARRRCARRWARSSRCPVARVDGRRDAARRRASRSSPRAGEPLARAGGRATLVVGAEREGLPDEVVAACDARRATSRSQRSR